MREYYWPKSTGTHADALGAARFAKLLSAIGNSDAPRQVTLIDVGSHYRLDVATAILDEDVAHWDGDPFYPYILGLLKTDDDPGPEVIDYVAESKRLESARKARPRTARRRDRHATTEDAALAAADAEPHREIALLRAYNGMRKGFFGDLHMHRALRGEAPRDAVARRLVALRSRERVPVEAPPFDLKLSASQWFMPTAGKGVSRVKANGAAPGQFPARLVDWFESWMRFIGMYQAMTAHSTGDDLVACVPAPGASKGVTLHSLAAVRDNVGGRRVRGGNLEVRVILETCRALVKHSIEYAESPGAFRFARRRPSEVIAGLHATTYKKMGTASAVMNVAFLGLPGWHGIETRADAVGWLDALEDLDKFQRQFVNREGKIEDPDALRMLRDFLSHGTLNAALAFLGRTAVAVMSRLAGGNFTHLLSTETLGRVLMGQDTVVQTIIRNAGFQGFARAIRAATVHAMLYPDTRMIEPFYGLAQTWKQHAGDKVRFAALVGEFVQQFNAKVARKREDDNKKGGSTAPISLITDEELRQVLQLVEEPGSSSALVAHLLLGFGYAIGSKKSNEAPEKGE